MRFSGYDYLAVVLWQSALHPEQEYVVELSLACFRSIIRRSPTVIRVDRFKPITYPTWMSEVTHPEIENGGPSQYDLQKVMLYLYFKCRGAGKSLADVYATVLRDGDLHRCLGLRDALAIQKAGSYVARRALHDKGVFCWRSVVKHSEGHLCVPYVVACAASDEVVIDWPSLEKKWDHQCFVTAFFPEKKRR